MSNKEQAPGTAGTLLHSFFFLFNVCKFIIHKNKFFKMCSGPCPLLTIVLNSAPTLGSRRSHWAREQQTCRGVSMWAAGDAAAGVQAGCRCPAQGVRTRESQERLLGTEYVQPSMWRVSNMQTKKNWINLWFWSGIGRTGVNSWFSLYRER